MKNKIFLITGLLLVNIFSAKAQNSPLFIWGGGLDGTTYQKTGIYSELYGLLIEAPLDASGSKLPIQFGWRGAGSYALKILSNGNIGVGTSNPGHKLDVQGGTANVNLDNISALGGQLTISNGYGNLDGAVRLNLNNGGAVSWIKGIVTGPNTNTGSAMVFGVPSETTDGIERMRITSSGDVGIGTIDPKGYKLAVNGKIRTQEIKVETANWPDYVFNNDYQLPSLQQTEQHIKEKRHLPGIPSAAEVKANGIDLGEMNAKLLQKIEELTLHLIEKEKEIVKTNNRVEELALKLEELTHKLN
ncbi:hypothetical protein [Pedobacter heparinus]|uniref:hypothetical protein n=1 Tax=Pedobacter heparinus TaxID=984 RepID=UPI0029300D2C|nr:hypothetical protein [Pedobacter heparinus]